MSTADPQPIRHVALSYDQARSRESALRIVLSLRPDWELCQDSIEFVRFTDGITNTLLKACNRLPGLSQSEMDAESILLRAYGKGTDVLIDREVLSHSLLAQYGLASPLLARFDNGLSYKFVQGSVCSPADLRRPDVWRGVARRLGQWHASLPVSSISTVSPLAPEHDARPAPRPGSNPADAASRLTPGKPAPNVWSVLQKWILALPTGTAAQQTLQSRLQRELEWLVGELGDAPPQPFVFAHCDLLSGNVLVQPAGGSDAADAVCSVFFIDYEYACAAPAAFDIANHFAEWGGFDCDCSVLPTRAQRRAFLAEYLRSCSAHGGAARAPADVDGLFAAVDRFRGVPGFYWGVWALIQAQISLIDFDYAKYAAVRLGEYWAWKDACGHGAHGAHGSPDAPLRERRWAQDE